MKVFKINSNSIHSYAAKEAGKIALLFIVIFALLMFGLSFGLNEGYSIMDLIMPKIHIFLLILAFIFFTLFLRWINYAKSTLFIFDEHNKQIIKGMNANTLNAINQHAQNKQQRRHGTNTTQIIPFENITSMDIKDSGINIKSSNYNFWNGNGKIFIPKEIENFDKLVQLCQGLKNTSTK